MSQDLDHRSSLLLSHATPSGTGVVCPRSAWPGCLERYLTGLVCAQELLLLPLLPAAVVALPRPDEAGLRLSAEGDLRENRNFMAQLSSRKGPVCKDRLACSESRGVLAGKGRDGRAAILGEMSGNDPLGTVETVPKALRRPAADRVWHQYRQPSPGNRCRQAPVPPPWVPKPVRQGGRATTWSLFIPDKQAGRPLVVLGYASRVRVTV
jgi:hypothetical protein